MHNRNRPILIVLDGVGDWGDGTAIFMGIKGVNSWAIPPKRWSLNLPNLEKLAWGRITYLEGVRPLTIRWLLWKDREMSPVKTALPAME